MARWLAAALAVALVDAGSVAAQAPPARGRTIFESQCSRCHGITGGGAMGPSLRRPVLDRAPDDSAFHENCRAWARNILVPRGQSGK